MNTHIFFASKKVSLVTLAVTAVVVSRSLFFFFDDPEGPNLLVVGVTALVVYLSSLVSYIFGSTFSNPQRFWIALFVQVALVIIFYVLGTRF